MGDGGWTENRRGRTSLVGTHGPAGPCHWRGDGVWPHAALTLWLPDPDPSLSGKQHQDETAMVPPSASSTTSRRGDPSQSHSPLTPHRSFPRGPAARKSSRMSGPNRSHWGRLLQGWLPAAGAAPQEGGPSRRCGRQRRAHKPRLRGNSSAQLRPYSGGSRHIPGPQGLTRTREHPF